MNIAAINGAINLTNSSIISANDLTLVKDYNDGHKAYANPTGTKVAIFADMEDGDLFNISGWTGNASKTLEEIADGLYA